MPIDTEGWRAGIVNNKFNYIFHTKRSVYSSLLNFYLSMASPIVSTICYLYFFITISVFNIPLSILLTFLCINIPLLDSFWSAIVCQSDKDVSRKLMINLVILTNYMQTMVLLFNPSIGPILFSMKTFSLKANEFFRANKVTVLVLSKMTQCFQLLSYLIYYLISTDIVRAMLILSGNVHENPDPTDCNLKFFHWNFDSISACGNTKLLLIEAYNSVFSYDLIAISDSRLDRSISNGDIQIGGFCCDVFRRDHPSNTGTPGGVCLYYKEDIPIRRRNDLKILEETIVNEISLRHKKVFFVVLYRHPNQTSDEFDLFLDRLQLTIDRIKSCTPHCIVITGNFNCRSKQWWPGDVELPEGLASDEFIESNNLTQLIDEPTNIRSTGMSCIDLSSQINRTCSLTLELSFSRRPLSTPDHP